MFYMKAKKCPEESLGLKQILANIVSFFAGVNVAVPVVTQMIQDQLLILWIFIEKCAASDECLVVRPIGASKAFDGSPKPKKSGIKVSLVQGSDVSQQ